MEARPHSGTFEHEAPKPGPEHARLAVFIRKCRRHATGAAKARRHEECHFPWDAGWTLDSRRARVSGMVFSLEVTR
jgi:hypothetical protein